ncbi:SOS response-associated peptidase family protein [Lactobacillus sp. ESL0684]|uniref:SOS response-associated peptidase family protein n=1 Tax=Lactobacillus sp. ESL0684 TaxID=2983213 RepID=UPI0023F61B6A|nr:SOS response-associated peptidase family protein [Lactobacillus sp. ESL0684]WEV44025.1 SOS response-associated peptidase family protein [Lactobacillus sp. ESL0684]
MCNQFQLPSLSAIRKYLATDLHLPLVEPAATLPQNRAIFPKDQAPVLIYQNQQLQLISKSWGYPSPINQQKVLFNARVERFFENKASMWDTSFAKQRCLIIADQFFETGKQTYIANQRRYHERFSFRNPDEPLTLIAGIYQADQFAMVTTSPNAVMSPIHDRMPLVITPQELRQWLFQNFSSLVNRSTTPLAASKLPNRN